MKIQFDKKEKSILELDELLKGVGKNAHIAYQNAVKENGDNLKMHKVFEQISEQSARSR
ncbi:MAG: hypothetical protein Ctma_0060 [Catillopecten margaritatus gill symbiont]|uniref:Uncharacterized protein n=1 Tax=Catillopecten margaritatus gill symbiont TaxID=3083288 RepID=A0AAU6PEE3_9GAMM